VLRRYFSYNLLISLYSDQFDDYESPRIRTLIDDTSKKEKNKNKLK
jgi:nitrogen fixation-related uncharacterized protein